jgi:hypothetical protein
MFQMLRKLVIPSAIALGALVSFPTVASADTHDTRAHERERFERERLERERMERERIERERMARIEREREREHARACEHAIREGASWRQLREMRCVAR